MIHLIRIIGALVIVLGAAPDIGAQTGNADCGSTPNIPNAYIVDSSTTFVTYSCIEDYVLTGGNTLTCGTNGSWVEPSGGVSCVEKPTECLTPPTVLNAHQIQEEIGSWAIYSCDCGFTSNGANMTVECQGEDEWTVSFSCTQLPPGSWNCTGDAGGGDSGTDDAGNNEDAAAGSGDIDPDSGNSDGTNIGDGDADGEADDEVADTNSDSDYNITGSGDIDGNNETDTGGDNTTGGTDNTGTGTNGTDSADTGNGENNSGSDDVTTENGDDIAGSGDEDGTDITTPGTDDAGMTSGDEDDTTDTTTTTSTTVVDDVEDTSGDGDDYDDYSDYDEIVCGNSNFTCPANSVCLQNDYGVYDSCKCQPGYATDSKTGMCEECDNWTYGDECNYKCPCTSLSAEKCDTVTGNCTCNVGFEGPSCSDINECDDGSLCPEHFTCTNTPGSYMCSCPGGLCGNVSLEIVDGPREGIGRVELIVDGQRGTICDVAWDHSDALVVCRMHGYSDGFAVRGSLFGGGDGGIFVTHAYCSGTESNFLQCERIYSSTTYCVHSMDAGVICTNNTIESEMTMTFYGGYGPSGWVGMSISGINGSVCGDSDARWYYSRYCYSSYYCYCCPDHISYYSTTWQDSDASAVCKSFGYKSGLALHGADFGQGSDNFRLDVSCPSTAMSYKDCTFDHDPYCAVDASVICQADNWSDDYSIELVGGPSASSGRIEIIHGSLRGTVCDWRFDNAAADVICNMTGHSHGFPIPSSAFGVSSGTFFINTTACSGMEGSIFDCSEGYIDGCNHATDEAGVVCADDNWNSDATIRLVNGYYSDSNGIVVIEIGNVKATIKDVGWDNKEATAVCRHKKHYTFGIGVQGVFSQTLSFEHTEIGPLVCSGSDDEDTFLKCQRDYITGWRVSYGLAGAVCFHSGPDLIIQLVGGSTVNVGRIQVTSYGLPMTLSDSSFGEKEANVICRILGYSGAIAYGGTVFGTPTQCYQLVGVSCTGNETDLLDCMKSAYLTDSCYGYAGVRCHNNDYTPDLRVELESDFAKTYVGRIKLILDGIEGTVSADYWSDNEASVICRMLDSSLYSTGYGVGDMFGPGTGHHLVSDAYCTGTETSIKDCGYIVWGKYYSEGHGDDVGVVCIEDGKTYSFVPELVDGSADGSNGRLELIWDGFLRGTVCDEYSGSYAPGLAKAVCRTLGYGTGIPTLKSRFPASDGIILIKNFVCSDNAQSMDDCSFTMGDNDYCSNYADEIGVYCDDSIALSDPDFRIIDLTGQSSANGRLELAFGGTTFGFCSYSVNRDTANRLCAKITGSNRGVIARGSPYGTSNRALSNLQCTTNDPIENCFHNAYQSSYCYNYYTYSKQGELGLLCDPVSAVQVDFVDGTPELDGRDGIVEFTVGERTGRICVAGWDNHAASVVCRMKGYGAGLAVVPDVREDQFRYGVYGFYWFKDLWCDGTESDIFDCHYSYFGTYGDCYQFYAYVECFFGPAELLPYGLSNGDTALPKRDDFCQKIKLPFKVRMYGRNSKKVHICDNGVMTVGQRYIKPDPVTAQLMIYTTTKGRQKVRALCAYHADIDIKGGGGNIYYRIINLLGTVSSSDTSTVEILQDYIKDIHKVETFQASVVVLATWHRVQPYKNKNYASNGVDEEATFQIALISDGINTFSVFFYDKEGMNWTSSREIYVGYYAYGYSMQEDISFRRQALQIHNIVRANGQTGMLSHRLTKVGETTTNYEAVCLNWYAANFQDKTYIDRQMELLPNPPCNRGFLWFDPWWPMLLQPSRTDSSVLCSTVRVARWFRPHGRASCYDRTGSFINDEPEGGGYMKYHPFFDSVRHRTQDTKMKDYCCSRSSHCNLYYEVRPVGECYARFPATFASFWGDPHITTLDNKTYTFNGHGEYFLVQSNNFTLQCRTARALDTGGNETDATIFSGFAGADINGGTFSAVLTEDRTGLTIYGNDIDQTDNYKNLGNAFSYTSDTLDMGKSGDTLSVTFKSGIEVNITLAFEMLQVAILMPESFTSNVLGLLGNYDGMDNNDFIHPNGTVLANGSSDRTIFNYAQTWTVNDATSLFDYPIGKTHANYSDPAFVPIFLDEYDEVAVNNAISTCGGVHKECMLDLLATGNEEVAEHSNAVEQDSGNLQAELDKELPTVSGPVSLETELGQSAEVIVTGTGEGIIDFIPSSETSSGVFITKVNPTTAKVSWTHTENSIVNVSVIVTDEDGVQSPAHRLVIRYCTGCNGHGSCNYSQERDIEDDEDTTTILVSTTHFIYVECECSDYWTGDDCEIDIDGCEDEPCLPPRTCQDNNATEHEATGLAYVCQGDCPVGYEVVEVNGKCIDIDECATANDCEQICNNTAGGYICSCWEGYRISDTNSSICQDVNECVESSTSYCDQICTNRDGGYACSCRPGYSLISGTGICTQDEDLCASSGLDCSNAHGCTEENGIHKCFCNLGYTFDDDVSNTCVDVNECDQGVCTHGCNNTGGGYSCFCYAGYQLDSTGNRCDACEYPYYGVECAFECQCEFGATCDSAKGCICPSGYTGTNCNVDIDECTDNPDTCVTFRECVNALGSYTCPCISGYEEGESTGACVDVNECLDEELNLCAHYCHNEAGGFTCSCQPGYNTNGTDCVDIDECETRQAQCEQICVNVDGTYNCECYPGFEINETVRTVCDMFADYCEEYSALNCSHFCVVDRDIGLDKCACKPGYDLDSDGLTCIDINECANNDTNLCVDQDSCVNTDGGFYCECNIGYWLENDGITCTECDEFHYGVNCSEQCNCSAAGALRCDSVAGCMCSTGWTGVRCDEDLDECTEGDPCNLSNSLHMECVNYQGTYGCLCLDGYEKSNNECIDIDECLSSDSNDCEQICNNEDGGYSCSCSSGFLLVNETFCQDIDECLVSTTCEHYCMNLEGSFRCSCNIGYTLNVIDRKSCIECDEDFWGNNCLEECICNVTRRDYCNKTNGKCVCNLGWEGTDCSGDINECNYTCLGEHMVCTNTPGNFSCTCELGYEMEMDACIDIDECSRSLDDCEQLCNNTDGWFGCYCEDGYLSVGNNCSVCTDWTYGQNCSDSCVCVQINTETCDTVNGTCSCKTGWEEDDCNQDVDECTDASVHNCPALSACTNTAGSFYCQCEIGYNLTVDKTKCEECDSTLWGMNCSKPCLCDFDNTDICNRSTGECVCSHGWEGLNCTQDIDECNITCTDAHMLCTNTPGSFLCDCESGYNMTSTGCSDVDECLDKLDDCEHFCNNTDGGYTCYCRVGYKADQNTCSVCVGWTFGYDCEESCVCNQTTTDVCINTNGTCACKDGWSDTDCSEDIDECADDNIHQCPDHSDCVNTQGSFYCQCHIGYKMDVSGTVCEECDDFHFGLDCASECLCIEENRESCNKINGSCTCYEGWEDPSCSTDINECNVDPTLCTDYKELCQNTAGSYYCYCEDGFRMTNNNCVDVDECAENSDNCQQICHNTEGGFNCSCNIGFHTDDNLCKACTGYTYGVNCFEICVCNSTNVANPAEPCHDVTGECLCHAGWTGSECEVDIDECDVNNGNCPDYSTCLNSPGSYSCNCWTNFEKDLTGKCIVIDGLALVQRTTCTLSVLNSNSTGSRRKRATLTTGDVKDMLFVYYNATLFPELLDVLIEYFEQDSSSITVTYSLVIEDSITAITKTAEANVALVSGNTLLSSGGVTLGVESISIGGTTVNSGDDVDLESQLCAVFLGINGECPSNHECQVHSGKPQCIDVSTQVADEDKPTLIIGLAAGIGGAAAIALAVVVFLIYRHKMKNKLKKPTTSKVETFIPEPSFVATRSYLSPDPLDAKPMRESEERRVSHIPLRFSPVLSKKEETGLFPRGHTQSTHRGSIGSIGGHSSVVSPGPITLDDLEDPRTPR